MAEQHRVTLKHPKLDTTITQPLSAARHLIEQGGWELDADNHDDVKKALKGVKPGYVGGDQGSKAEGGDKPPEPSGRAPGAKATAKAGA